jgi:hypothetical protein
MRADRAICAMAPITHSKKALMVFCPASKAHTSAGSPLLENSSP